MAVYSRRGWGGLFPDMTFPFPLIKEVDFYFLLTSSVLALDSFVDGYFFN